MSGIYVHIPFCKSRCIYCDFYSTTGGDNAQQARYVTALIEEYRKRIGELKGSPVTTLYIGGGTPSQLSPDLLSQLFAAIDHSSVSEFTVEVNPDDVDADYAEALYALGVNRVSMGVQSFIDNELKIINRRHTSKQAIDAVSILKSVGINNISIDLIYGLPLQSLQSWQVSVEQAVRLGVQHISAYNLTYEEGTLLTRLRDTGQIAEANDELCVAMYNLLADKLRQAGYEHYEISNFALSGFRSRHNSAYWDFTPYLGLGAGAHSFDGETRRYNPADINSYLTHIEGGTTAAIAEPMEWWEHYDELIMLRLRTADGLDARDIIKRFGEKVYRDFLIKAQPLVDNGELMRTGYIYSIAPTHVMRSDAVILQLMH